MRNVDDFGADFTGVQIREWTPEEIIEGHNPRTVAADYLAAHESGLFIETARWQMTWRAFRTLGIVPEGMGPREFLAANA